MSKRRLVRYDRHDAVAEISLATPPANQLTYEVLRQLDDAVLEARFDEDVSVLILTGEGEQAFSEGTRPELLRHATPDFCAQYALFMSETLRRIENTPKLVLAALNGNALAAGLGLALACDLRLARDDGVLRLGFPEIEAGTLPEAGATQRLLRLVGRSRALRLVAEGTRLDVAAARELGLIDEVLEASSDADFRAQARRFAARFTAPGKASLAVGLLKRSCRLGEEISLEPALAHEQQLMARLARSQDTREGLAALLEGRPAAFQGL